MQPDRQKPARTKARIVFMNSPPKCGDIQTNEPAPERQRLYCYQTLMCRLFTQLTAWVDRTVAQRRQATHDFQVFMAVSISEGRLRLRRDIQAGQCAKPLTQPKIRHPPIDKFFSASRDPASCDGWSGIPRVGGRIPVSTWPAAPAFPRRACELARHLKHEDCG
jgi:hypothetical protein